LLSQLNITDVQVLEYGGKPGLGRFLKTLPQISGYREITSLGITRDADDSARSAFQSICSGLRNARLPVPNKLGEITTTTPQISILILPDNQNNGMLEDVCLAALRSEPILSCIDDYFNCIYQKIGQNPKSLAKARIHAWLSAQIEPDKRLGQAAQAGYLPWNSPEFDRLKQFFLSL
jgi:hypothetical protein